MADVQTPGNEAAHDDTDTARVETRRVDVDAREQTDIPDRLVRGDAPDEFGRVRRNLVVREQSLLFGPVLRGRFGNCLLAKHDPPSISLVVPSERLLRVPAAFLRVEVVGPEVADFEHRHGPVGARDDHVAVVAAPFEHLLRGHGIAQLRELIVRVDDAPRLGDFLGEDEILTEDGAYEVVVRHLRREPVDAGHDVGLKLAATLEETLEAILVGIGLLEGAIARVLNEPVVLLLLIRRDRLDRHRRSSFCICQIRSSGCGLSLHETSFLVPKISLKKLVS